MSLPPPEDVPFAPIVELLETLSASSRAEKQLLERIVELLETLTVQMAPRPDEQWQQVDDMLDQ